MGGKNVVPGSGAEKTLPIDLLWGGIWDRFFPVIGTWSGYPFNRPRHFQYGHMGESGGGPNSYRVGTPDPWARLGIISLALVFLGVSFAIPAGAGLLPRRREDADPLFGPLEQSSGDSPLSGPQALHPPVQSDPNGGAGPPPGPGPPTGGSGPPAEAEPSAYAQGREHASRPPGQVAAAGAAGRSRGGGSRRKRHPPDPGIRLAVIALLAMAGGVCFAIPAGAALLPRRREECVVLPGPGWLVEERGPDVSPQGPLEHDDTDVDPGGGPSPDGRALPTEGKGPPGKGRDSAPVREHASASAAPRGPSGPPRGGGGSRSSRRRKHNSTKSGCAYRGCRNRAYLEVYYSKRGLKPRKGWVGAVEPATGIRVRIFATRLPPDLRWSHLCRRHFVQERSKLLGWCSP